MRICYDVSMALILIEELPSHRMKYGSHLGNRGQYSFRTGWSDWRVNSDSTHVVHGLLFGIGGTKQADEPIRWAFEEFPRRRCRAYLLARCP